MHNVEYKIPFFEQKSLQTYYSSPTEEFMSLQRASSLDDIKNAKNRKLHFVTHDLFYPLKTNKQTNKTSPPPTQIKKVMHGFLSNNTYLYDL